MSGRRKEHTERRTFEPQRLWNAHQEIIRMAALGMKHVEIAQALGITAATVSNTLNCRLGEQQMALVQAGRNSKTMDVVEEMKKLVPQAVEVYKTILAKEDADLSVRMKAADQVLARAGFPTPKQIDINSTVRHLTPEDVERIRKRGEELKAKIFEGDFEVLVSRVEDEVPVSAIESQCSPQFVEGGEEWKS